MHSGTDGATSGTLFAPRTPGQGRISLPGSSLTKRIYAVNMIEDDANDGRQDYRWTAIDGKGVEDINVKVISASLYGWAPHGGKPKDPTNPDDSTGCRTGRKGIDPKKVPATKPNSVGASCRKIVHVPAPLAGVLSSFFSEERVKTGRENRTGMDNDPPVA